MSAAAENRNRRLLRARDRIDLAFAEPLDVAALASVAHLSPSQFARQFRATFGEAPHRYLQRRRIERAMELLRDTDRSVSEICLDVGFASLASFSRTFSAVVGEAPSRYRVRTRAARASGRLAAEARAPACWEKALQRPIGRVA